MIQEWISHPRTYHLVIGIIIVLLFGPLTWLVKRLLGILGHKVFARTETLLDDRILAVVTGRIRPIMLMIALRLAVNELRNGTAPDETTWHQMLDYGEAILYTVLALLILRVVLGILREIVEWYLEKLSSEGASNLKNTLGPLTSKVMNVLFGMVAIIIVLDHFGINIGSLLVSLGVGSLAVALAAQDTLANMISGFVILVDRPFRVGDRIEIASGLVGDVTEIGLRSTKVLNFDNNVIILPNAELVKGRIVNFSYPAHPMRMQLRFDVAYGTDIERVRTILLTLAQPHPALLKDPPPQVVVAGISEAAVQVTLIGRASSYTKVWDTEVQMREEIYGEFLRQGIQVPVQRRILHMAPESARNP
jgi:small-conductance mechanosensitive channel